MNALLFPLLGLTLLVCGAVTSLPAVVRSREPIAAPLADGSRSLEHWLVQAPGNRWYLEGVPITRQALADRLRREGRSVRIHLLPAATVPVAEVHRGMVWLRQGGGTVALELAGRR